MSNHIRGLILCALGSLCWSISGIAGQFLLEDKSFIPSQLTTVRMLGAGILLLVCEWFSDRDRIRAVIFCRDNWWKLFWFGVIGLMVTQFTYFESIRYSNAPTATIISYLLPIIVVGWDCLTSRRWPYRNEVFCTVLAFAGTFLLVTEGHLDRLAVSPLALLWGISSAFTAAFYNLQPRGMIKKYTAPPVLAWGMLIGGLASLPFTDIWHFTGVIDWESLVGYLVVTVVGTVLSFALYLNSSKYLSAMEMTIIAAVEPLASVILEMLIFGQMFNGTGLFGFLFILVAVLAVSRH